MRKVFFETLQGIFQEDKSVYLMTADLGVKFFQDFKNIDPQRVINVGVAETNMISIASGLSLAGKNVYCYSIIPFLTMRALEQIRVDLCYPNLNVKLLGAGGGLVYGVEGMTHHAIEDIAIMRSLPNMTVVCPGDSREAGALAQASLPHQGPLYIRFGRDSDPEVNGDNFQFKIGKGIVVEEGKDVCLMATGTMLYLGKIVSDALKEKGLNPSLVSLHTVKPLDEGLVRDCAKKYRVIFTLEEHNILGGLGGAVAEVLAEARYGGIFKRIGIQDKYSFPEVGSPDYLREKAGLSPEEIIQTISETIKKA
ncbi:MAG: 1-deoxy-D-xylulose-5-phosphate synthase [Candidatus Nealsonbacteria bacterium]|nr:1-deoxy-D-xylulose-5-phosphate synthase [Candidatus Nealsonbacteria bacterium]